MANYLTGEGLQNYISEQEIIRLTDDQNYGHVNTAVLDNAIRKSGEELESYLRDVYITALPVPLPSELESILADIIIYNLYKRRMQTDMPPSIVQIYNTAISKLEKIRKGIITIDLGKVDQGGFIKINKTDSDRLFNKGTLSSL